LLGLRLGTDRRPGAVAWSSALRDGRADRGPGLADRLPAPVVRQRTEPGGASLVEPERSLANLTKHNIDQLTALVKTRLRRMQYRPGLLEGFLAKTGLDLTPLRQPSQLKIVSFIYPRASRQ
jgi:hypothetical protein